MWSGVCGAGCVEGCVWSGVCGGGWDCLASIHRCNLQTTSLGPPPPTYSTPPQCLVNANRMLVETLKEEGEI